MNWPHILIIALIYVSVLGGLVYLGRAHQRRKDAAQNLDKLARGRAELRARCGDFETMFYDWEVLAMVKRGQLDAGTSYAAIIGPAALKFETHAEPTGSNGAQHHA